MHGLCTVYTIHPPVNVHPYIVSFAKRACMYTLQRGKPGKLVHATRRILIVHAPPVEPLFLLTVQSEGLLNACVSLPLETIYQKQKNDQKNKIPHQKYRPYSGFVILFFFFLLINWNCFKIIRLQYFSFYFSFLPRLFYNNNRFKKYFILLIFHSRCSMINTVVFSKKKKTKSQIISSY